MATACGRSDYEFWLQAGVDLLFCANDIACLKMAGGGFAESGAQLLAREPVNRRSCMNTILLQQVPILTVGSGCFGNVETFLESADARRRIPGDCPVRTQDCGNFSAEGFADATIEDSVQAEPTVSGFNKFSPRTGVEA